MKGLLLTRLQVAELRQFRQPFELADLQPGLNLIAGPNESGKSTLVRAIRAAFFERHRSTSVDDLRPYGDSVAAPTIELDFLLDGVPHRLRKSFLGRKRCELQAGSRRLEGQEAEDFLAERLGFQFAAKGASREEHWGIPGLLWIEQGSAQALRTAVEHAAGHLQRALDASLGEVAASAGDEVLALVREARSELLTGTGKPRGALQQALDEALRVQAECDALQLEAGRYRDQVDQCRALRAEQAAEAADAPWQRLRRQQAEAEAALRDADGLAAQREREAAEGARTQGLVDLLRQQLAAMARQVQDLQAREVALQRSAQALEAAGAAEQAAALAQGAASERLQAARAALALARQEDSRLQLQRQAADAQQRAAEVAALLQRAGAEAARATALRREADALQVPARALKTLRDQQQQARELDIRLATLATRLRWTLQPAADVQLDGQTLSGSGERLLSSDATLAIAGVGTLQLAPGGADLADLTRQRERLHDEHQAALQRLGLATLAEVEARDQAQRARLQEAGAAEQALRLLAPQGLEALQAAHDRAQALRAEAESALAQLPPAPAERAPDGPGAEAAHDAAQHTAEAATAQRELARRQLATAASQAEAARRERDALAALLGSPDHQAQQRHAQARLIDAQALLVRQQAALQALDARIAAARPDILRQDVDRLRRSADEAERAHHARALRIGQLEATLAQAGAQGLDEALATATLQAEAAARRRDELQRRAQALDFLLGKLEARRQALKRRLQAPLQRHLDHYLGLLFPGARLEVDEHLQPGRLQRGAAADAAAGGFDTLSFGAREQLGVLSRLAYADLLREASRPTLLILDDALVHSDEPRLAAMKRVIFDAAQRHQVLLFTCHPAAWRDMGAAPRMLR